MEEITCSICLDLINDSTHSVVLDCGHVFHTTPCFLKLATYAFVVNEKSEVECPNCRQTTSTIGVPNIGSLIETLFFPDETKIIPRDLEENKY